MTSCLLGYVASYTVIKIVLFIARLFVQRVCIQTAHTCHSKNYLLDAQKYDCAFKMTKNVRCRYIRLGRSPGTRRATRTIPIFTTCEKKMKIVHYNIIYILYGYWNISKRKFTNSQNVGCIIYVYILLYIITMNNNEIPYKNE